MIDVKERAASLQVVDYYKLPNPAGKVTPKELYEHSAGQHVYEWVTLMGLIMHGTVGADTLSYWLRGGSMQGPKAPYSMAQFLMPRDRNTVCKMAPSGKSTNHVGASKWHDPDVPQPLGAFFLGIECEDWQNWNKGANAQKITDDQHVKSALVWAYESALDHQQKGTASKAQDRYVLSHSQIAVPFGRRGDPEAGLWNWQLFWYVVREIRKESNWPSSWPARWTGTTPDV